MQSPSEKRLHALFTIGVFIKAVDSAIEIVAGFVLFLVPAHTLSSLGVRIVGDEISEQPWDALWNLISQSIHHAGGTRTFWATLLLAHGILKLSFVIGLIKRKIWAYPVAIGGFSVFIIYQIHRIVMSPSLFLEVLTFFDIMIVILIWYEYGSIRRHPHQP